MHPRWAQKSRWGLGIWKSQINFHILSRPDFFQCDETSFLLTCENKSRSHRQVSRISWIWSYTSEQQETPRLKDIYKNLSNHPVGKVRWGSGEVAMNFATADYIQLKVNDQLSNILCHVGMHMPRLNYSANLRKSSEMLVVNWSYQINSLSSISSLKILPNN